MKTYSYRIGARNAGGGLDSTGETGTVEASSAREACAQVRDGYPQAERAGLVVCASSDDRGETAEMSLA